MSAFENFEQLNDEYNKVLLTLRNLCEEKKDKYEWTEENSSNLEQLIFDFVFSSEILDGFESVDADYSPIDVV